MDLRTVSDHAFLKCYDAKAIHSEGTKIVLVWAFQPVEFAKGLAR